MREILFRGKRKDNGEWVEGNLFGPDNPETPTQICILTNIVRISYDIDPESIGQYTGLTDSNGKKIFEDDKIRYVVNDEYGMYLESLEYHEDYEGIDFSNLWTIDTVVYGIEVGYPAFDLNSHEWECNGLSNLNESCQYFYEVIGNIHDNPELLKGCADNGNL